MDMKQKLQKNVTNRPFRVAQQAHAETQQAQALTPPPLVGLTNLYLSGIHPHLKAGDPVVSLLVPGGFKQGCLWMSLCAGDVLFGTLLVNGAEVMKDVGAVEGMNRFDLDLAFMEGDKVQLLVTGGNAREVWWGLRLAEGVI